MSRRNKKHCPEFVKRFFKILGYDGLYFEHNIENQYCLFHKKIDIWNEGGILMDNRFIYKGIGGNTWATKLAVETTGSIDENMCKDYFGRLNFTMVDNPNIVIPFPKDEIELGILESIYGK